MDCYLTFVSDRKRINCNCGDRFDVTYKPHFEADGTMNLKPSGKRDVYEEIQSHQASCDINRIIERFTETGDESLFHVRQAFFGDFAEMPKTYAEMFQRVADAEAMFMNLKPEVRAEFNNNLSEFLASVGSEKFMKVFGMETVQNPVEAEAAASEKKKTVQNPVEAEAAASEKDGE